MRQLISLSLFASLALTGCYRSTERGGDTRRDAAIILSDGGIGRDASPPRTDSGRPDPGPPDSGPPVGCESETIPPYDGPACSPDVNECIRTCSERGGAEDCPNECIGMDPTCARCFYAVLLACANELGCQREWGEYACCAEGVPDCRGLEGVDRLSCTDRCPAEIDQYTECLNRIPIMECLQRASVTCDIRT